jgi:hypothetical protein
VRFLPTFRAEGTGLVFRHHGRTDVPPLIELQRFTATSSLYAALRRRVSRVELEGLRITVARDDEEEASAGEATQRDDSGGSSIVVSTIVADDTHLEILPREAWKAPLTFDLHGLTLHDAGPASAMRFDAVLTNPKPPGRIVTSGSFGPWDADEPRRTPLSGEYTFTDADLSVFNGISGILSSVGEYGGVLERIAVSGTTDVPNFAATGSAVHLRTRFDAVVDGTSGDTYLEPVEAMFLDSHILATGKVAQVPDGSGKAVVLDVTVTEARVEDLVTMAVPITGEPPLTGPIAFTAAFHLPPGDADVMEKLELDGRFRVRESTFTSAVQEKVDDFSQRAQGRPGTSPDEDAEAQFDGEFHMSAGAIAFPLVAFEIPGATVRISGNHVLRARTLDFEGHALLDARVSETVTGWKSILLKLVDPFFRDEGRTSVPIRVRGTIDEPDFGLALGGARKAPAESAAR